MRCALSSLHSTIRAQHDMLRVVTNQKRRTGEPAVTSVWWCRWCPFRATPRKFRVEHCRERCVCNDVVLKQDLSASIHDETTIACHSVAAKGQESVHDRERLSRFALAPRAMAHRYDCKAKPDLGSPANPTWPAAMPAAIPSRPCGVGVVRSIEQAHRTPLCENKATHTQQHTHNNTQHCLSAQIVRTTTHRGAKISTVSRWAGRWW